MRCLKCGSENPDSASICMNCGNTLAVNSRWKHIGCKLKGFG